MNIRYASSRRSGVGSILGGVFLLLIFSSMVTSIFIIDNYRQLTDEAYIKRVNFDNNKVHENLTFENVTKKPNNYLNITVRNIGNVGTQIVYIGELNTSSGDLYNRVDLFLNPLEIGKDILKDTISIEENETKDLTLLTSYGNQYFYHYNEIYDNGPVTIRITLLDDNFDDLTNWENTNWVIQTDQWVSANSSVKSNNGNEGDLQSISLNSSSALSLNISFWYRLSNGIESNDVAFMIYDGQGGPDLIDYLYGTEDTWTLYNYTTTDPQYFISDFYIRFNSNLQSNEMVWIDDLKIIIET